MILHRAGNLAQAAAIYQRLLQQSPRDPDLLHLLGLAAYQGGNYPAALDLIGRAVSLRKSEPGFHSNLGQVFEAMKHYDDAIACYRRALALDPDFAEANSNLGGLLASRRLLDEAITLCRRAIAARPAFAEAWCNLGLAFNYRDQLDLAADSCRKALGIWPECAQAWHNLGNTLSRQGLQDEAIAAFDKAIAYKPGYAAALDNLCFAWLYRAGSTPSDILAVHRRYAEQVEAPLKPRWPRHANRRDPDRRLKIGYVSPDFRRHSVAYFVEPLLACHDRSVVEVHAYFNHARADEVTARLRAMSDHWVDCANLSDDELAERIRADGIDILVDLAGHSANNRLTVFARKPAPVQATWLGYPATTGLSAMDWRLTTRVVDPEGSEACYSERLWYLPRTLWCYRPATDAPDPDVRDADTAGRPVNFGSINNYPKVSPASIALWSRILRELPQSRLVMTHVPEGSARDLLCKRFAGHGIGPDRLQLNGRLSATEFQVLAGAIDIALDPFPYNGTTTTCESLWRGIPVVTLTGDQSVSRSGHALLNLAGLGEYCARDEDDYVRIAAGLARDRARLQDLRAGLRVRLEASPLRDEAGFTREIEDAYRAMWREWCASPSRDGA